MVRYSLSLEKYRMIRNIFVISPRIEWLFMSEGCSMEYQGPSFFCKILLNAFLPKSVEPNYLDMKEKL